MKRFITFILISVCITTMVKSQPFGFSVFAAPTVTMINYKDFNTFAASYNSVNKSGLKGFTSPTLGFSYGVDLYLATFYFGLYINRLTANTDPVVISNYSTRNFDLRLNSWVSNVGFNIGKGSLFISPYVALGMNYVDLDAYVEYFDKYRYYGNYKLDGVYSGTNMLAGFGGKITVAKSIFTVSLGCSKLFSIFPTAQLHDFSGDDVKELGSDWAAFSSQAIWDYKGGYVSSRNNQLIFQLSIGIFIGDSDD